jgi:hydrogenase maturation protease
MPKAGATIRLLVIGFGNPLRSDDALGWHVAQELSRTVSPDGVQVIAAHQLTPDLSEVISRAQHVLFIDASRNGEPGSLNCVEVTAAPSPSRFTHDLSPAAVLKMAAELYGPYPTAHLLTITGESFETGETMSPTVLAAIPALMAEVRNFVEDIRGPEIK